MSSNIYYLLTKILGDDLIEAFLRDNGTSISELHFLHTAKAFSSLNKRILLRTLQSPLLSLLIIISEHLQTRLDIIITHEGELEKNVTTH